MAPFPGGATPTNLASHHIIRIASSGVICPKCLSIQTDSALTCQKCGAQLHTGLFRKPIVAPEEPVAAGPSATASRRATMIAAGVFAVAVLALLLLLSRLELPAP